MAKYINKDALVAEVKRLIAFYSKEIEDNKEDPWAMDIAKRDILQEILSFLDNLEVKEVQEEPVSEDLEKAAEQDVCEVVNCCSVTGIPNDHIPSWVQDAMVNEFIHGAQWKENHLWKPADGDDLPEYDREVIVLTQPYPLEGSEFAVSFAHRPDPKGWDGKSITTGEVEHYTPKTYNKGGWNIPNVKWWLDVYKLPNVEE